MRGAAKSMKARKETLAGIDEADGPGRRLKILQHDLKRAGRKCIRDLVREHARDSDPRYGGVDSALLLGTALGLLVMRAWFAIELRVACRNDF
jgi:hypothetical protein